MEGEFAVEIVVYIGGEGDREGGGECLVLGEGEGGEGEGDRVVGFLESGRVVDCEALVGYYVCFFGFGQVLDVGEGDAFLVGV